MQNHGILIVFASIVTFMAAPPALAGGIERCDLGFEVFGGGLCCQEASGSPGDYSCNTDPAPDVALCPAGDAGVVLGGRPFCAPVACDQGIGAAGRCCETQPNGDIKCSSPRL